MAVVYRAKRPFDGLGTEASEHRAVVVEQTASLMSLMLVEFPLRWNSWTMGDVTLLPGLVDAHVHLVWDGQNPNPEGLRIKEGVPKSTLRAARHASDTLHSGVTTVRDLGCPDGISFALRNAIETGIADGPRIVAAGNAITMTGGHGFSFGVEADGSDAVRCAARSELHRGADSSSSSQPVACTGWVRTPARSS